MDDEKKIVEMTGTVVFLQRNMGSKSEAVLPFLYINKDEIVRIFFEGDNPFENNKLQEFDGKAITVAGYKRDDGMFIITAIPEDNIEKKRK